MSNIDTELKILKSLYALEGMIPGAALGGLVGRKLTKEKENRRRNILLGALAGGGAGGTLGYAVGNKILKDIMKQQKAWQNFSFKGSKGYKGFSGFTGAKDSTETLFKTMGIKPGNIKTKAQIHDVYKNLAKKYHPDMGGDSETMKKVNSAMDEIKKSSWYSKLAFLLPPSFYKKATLAKKVNPKTGNKEYALVSKSSGKVLEYFGTNKPSKEKYNEAEKRVQFFKHKKADEILIPDTIQNPYMDSAATSVPTMPTTPTMSATPTMPAMPTTPKVEPTESRFISSENDETQKRIEGLLFPMLLGAGASGMLRSIRDPKWQRYIAGAAILGGMGGIFRKEIKDMIMPKKNKVDNTQIATSN